SPATRSPAADTASKAAKARARANVATTATAVVAVAAAAAVTAMIAVAAVRPARASKAAARSEFRAHSSLLPAPRGAHFEGVRLPRAPFYFSFSGCGRERSGLSPP